MQCTDEPKNGKAEMQIGWEMKNGDEPAVEWICKAGTAAWKCDDQMKAVFIPLYRGKRSKIIAEIV